MRSGKYSTDEYKLEQLERSQLDKTRRRRDGRSRRKRTLLAGGMLLLGLIILGLPSLITHSPMAQSILASQANAYDLDATAESIRIGWITPLRVRGLQLTGRTNASEIQIEQLDVPLTVMDLITSQSSDFGEILVRGLVANCEVQDGTTSLENDLTKLINQPTGGASATGAVRINDITIDVSDQTTQQHWQLSQSSARIELLPSSIAAKFSGMLTEPSGNAGSVEGKLDWPTVENGPWNIDLLTDSLPLSGASLVRKRFPESTSIPQQLTGDATGSVVIAGTTDGRIEATLTKFEVRNLAASDPNSANRIWNNHLASVEGQLIVDQGRVIGRNVKAQTDFATATFNGSLSNQLTLTGTADNPLKWLDEIDGIAVVHLDLAGFDTALPGVLPLRENAKIVSGSVDATVQSVPNNGVFKSHLVVRTNAIRASAGNQNLVIDPVNVKATVAKTGGVLSAEDFEWKSAFGNAVGNGDLRSGNARVQVDFGRLMAMLKPILNVSDFSIAGIVNGDVRWDSKADQTWELNGNGNATDLNIAMADGRQIERPNANGKLQLLGHWDGRQIDRLSKATLSVVSTGFNFDAELENEVSMTGRSLQLPLKVSSRGQLSTVHELIASWISPELRRATGSYRLDGHTELSLINGSVAAARVTEITLDMTEPSVQIGETQVAQNRLVSNFQGEFAWPNNTFRTNKMSVAGDAISLAAKGSGSPQEIDLELAFRADLERLQNSVYQPETTQSGVPARQVSFQYRPADTNHDLTIKGQCEGQFFLKGPPQLLTITTKATAKDVRLEQPASAAGLADMTGPMRRIDRRGIGNQTRLVWSESDVNVNGDLRINTETGQTIAQSMKFATAWFATTLAGEIAWADDEPSIRLEGPARIKMDEVASRLTTLSGTPIRASGIHETPVRLRLKQTADKQLSFNVDGSLGWIEAEVGGLLIGRCEIPFTMSETTVSVPNRATLPVGGGSVFLAGDVHYGSGPLWINVPAGRFAESVSLTPEMTRNWLKYVAPIVADATQVDGKFSLDLDEALVVVEQPNQSRVRGQLKIENARVAAGPLATQVIGSVRQIKSLASLGSASATPRSSLTLIELRPQTVEFSLANNVVNHQRLYFDVDSAEIVTSGNVSLDGQLAMAAQVPLKQQWLGQSLQSLAGQRLSLPVTGTFTRPKIDSSSIRQTISGLTQTAVQTTVGNEVDSYLQQQLGKGQDEIKESIQKLGLDKLFGN